MLKNTTPVICAMALAMALLSCAREVLEPGQMITGKYAPDDGSGLASEYISFDGGELGLYRSQSDVLFTFAENKFWDCSKSTFLTTIGYRYSIQSGMMSSGFYSGPAELTGDKLKLGTKTYTRLDGFEQEKYSSIEVESELTVPYNSGGTFTPLSISRPIAAGKISASASSSSSWITGVKVEDGELRFNYSETKNPRDGYITITYTNAQSRTITVHQRPSTYIVLPSAANTVDYTGKSVSIPYSITGPVAGSSLSAKCTATWVKNISVTSSAVECTVDENTGNTSRNATFTLSYSGAADVTYVLTQDWASTSITTSPGALSCDYTGGSFSFVVNVQNPRSGVVVAATSKANWITNVSLTDGEVSFKVAENNTSSARTGEIELKYGSFSSYSFKVTQGWATTTVVLTPSSAEVGYTGGVGTFNFEVRNPRAGISVTAASQVAWITDVSIIGNRVIYTVGENNSGASRIGKIKLTYGSFATAEFSVTQAWSASTVVLTPSSAEVGYTGGVGTFNFEVRNPRAGISVTAASQVAWITDVSITGNRVIYTVGENNSAVSRTGKIKLTYSSYAAVEYSVMQFSQPVQSLSLDKTSLSLHPGDAETLVATVDPSDAEISWSSSSTAVATVSTTGKVTAVGNGNAVITASATDGSGKKATCRVTVTTLATGVSLNKTSLVLNEGGSETLTATIAPSTASDKSVTWSSTNTSVATVDQNGKVTAVSKGTATITATANDGSGKKATCAVTVKRLVSSISLNKTSITIYTGETETLTATILPDTADDRSITWSSSNTSIATVSSSGVVTAKALGTATVTATANDGSGKKATCSVTVKQYVTGVTLNKTSLSLNEGGSETLTATITPSTASDKSVTWSSTNTSVATVDQNGKVTAVSKGTATITATANDGSGKKATCTVRVLPRGAVDLGLSVLWASCNLGTTGFVNSPEEYGAYYAWGETEPKSDYSWSTYKFGTSDIGPFSKYNTLSSFGPVDNKVILETGPDGDDVASKVLGAKWRMPAEAEWTELRERCTWTWTAQNGINGRKVTGPNGNSIFLPATGYMYENTLKDAGTMGYYYSSSLNVGFPYRAWYLKLDSNAVNWHGSGRRAFGQTIRPVYDLSSTSSGNGISDIPYEEGGKE